MSAWDEMLTRSAAVSKALALRPEDFPRPERGEGYAWLRGFDFGKDIGTIATLSNAAWRTWHAHLYSCATCQTGTRCARGAGLLADAKAQGSEE